MLKRATIFYLVLFGSALLTARAQGFYTTAIGITSPGFLGSSFNLNFYFEAGAPVFGSGYHLYEIDSSSKLVFHGESLGAVGAAFSIVNDGDVLDHNNSDPPREVAEWVSTDSGPTISGWNGFEFSA